MTTPHNHTDTSRARAEYLDESGTALERAQDIVTFLDRREGQGATSREYARVRGYDSLPTWVTGSFSHLHNGGEIQRLAERRPAGRHSAYVYVDRMWVQDRLIVPFRSNLGITDLDRDVFAWAISEIDTAKQSGRELNERWGELSAVLTRFAG